MKTKKKGKGGKEGKESVAMGVVDRGQGQKCLLHVGV